MSFEKPIRVLAVALAAALAVAGCKGEDGGEKSAEAGDEKAGDALVEAELYVMSMCPHGARALEAFVPAAKDLGDALDLRIDYIGKKGPDGELKSMHGEKEVKGNIAQLCAEEIAPDKHYDFLICTSENYRKIPDNISECAEKVGIDPERLKKCTEGEQGQKLLAESFERAAKAGAKGSPTIKLAGEDYRGGRRAGSFLRAICEEIDDKDLPEACKNIPEPAEVKVIALTDERCGEDCEPEKVIKSLDRVFAGLKPEVLDWKEPRAKKIYEEAELDALPAFLFDESIEKDEEGSKHMARWLTPAGKYKSLRVKAEFDPEAEICDNEKDDTGNGEIDCDDPSCEGSLVCREEQPGRLDVFVMSQCPYGTMALDAMEEVFGAFGDDIDFNVNYIAKKTDDGFRSLHGQKEVDENIRELCAIEHYPEDRKYMDYILCRNENIKSSDWQSCAKDGISEKVIARCAEGPEGEKLLAENIELADQLGFSASPTWLVNNKHQARGVAPAHVQKAICEHNPDFDGCDKALSGPPRGPGGRPAPKGACE
jgi:predicted DsbA family dithiol-disulfide isomerase